MKNEVDALGRFVIPVKYRRKLNIQTGDELDIRLQKDSLLLKKAYPTCTFCEKEEDLLSYEDKMICYECSQKISRMVNPENK